jgi:beta-glucanase (GH16 family)
VKSFNDPKWDEKFHIWRMDWDEKAIKLYLDNELLNTIDLTKTLNPKGQKIRNPFHQKHYLLLNLAIGGNAGGDPSKTEFPSKYEIDYVRVYQQNVKK